jgi:hypothetical protein
MGSQVGLFDSQSQSNQRVVRPKSTVFTIRCVFLGLVALCLLSVGSIAMGLFAAAGAVFTWVMYLTSSLTLDDDGFVYRSLGRCDSYRWTDIDPEAGFRLITQRALLVIKVHQWVGWNFSSSYKKSGALRSIARAFGRCDARIDPLGHKASDLASVMTQYLHRARTKQPAPVCGFGPNSGVVLNGEQVDMLSTK